ncbi:MAG: hypothetical protein L0H79_10990, partial [Intrasporangium sp.]|uniref:hypothetical protein n=1 Tax=Intrasporangium sp. TaxID=1925024 RepID=UPI0026489844
AAIPIDSAAIPIDSAAIPVDSAVVPNDSAVRGGAASGLLVDQDGSGFSDGDAGAPAGER